MRQVSTFVLVLVLACLPVGVATGAAGIWIVSIASDGTQANDPSFQPAISADGRYVAYSSAASNLVPGDSNGKSDIFVHDTLTGQVALVSVSSSGTQGDETSQYASISADGGRIAFVSDSRTLVPGDTNDCGNCHGCCRDVFVHDLLTGQTTRVSVASNGTQANDRSEEPHISADGRFVAYTSLASNLVPGDTNRFSDVFVHDLQTGGVTRVSVASDGAEADCYSDGPSISADGRFVAFASSASNLVPNDSNWYHDVFVHDRQTGSTTRVSVASDGTQGGASSYEPCISADGRYAVFVSDSRALVPGDTNDKNDVFVHDRLSGQTTRANVDSHGAQANCWSHFPVVSSDGRFIAFESCAWNLAYNDLDSDPDIFVHDRDSGQTVCASVAWNGSPGNGRSDHGLAISGDGRCVAFASTSSNLVPDDRNGTMDDIFLRDMTIPTPTPTATSTPTATPTPTSTLTPTPTPTPTTGTIYGEVWNDLDRDGEKEAGEPPLAGAQIRLKDSSHVLLAIWITQETGSYTFANLHPGAYYVNETDPPGYGSSTIGEVLVYLSANQSLQISFGDHALPTATATHTPTAMPAMLTVYLPVMLMP